MSIGHIKAIGLGCNKLATLVGDQPASLDSPHSRKMVEHHTLAGEYVMKAIKAEKNHSLESIMHAHEAAKHLGQASLAAAQTFPHIFNDALAIGTTVKMLAAMHEADVLAPDGLGKGNK